MRFKNISLRMKLTITSVVISIMMCIILTFTTTRGADLVQKAIITEPAKSISDTIDPNIIPSAQLRAAYEQEYKDKYLTMTNTAIENFKENTIFSIITLIVLGSVITYYMASKVLKPLENLNSEVKNINVNNLEKNIKIPNTGDEIDELTKSFNEMTTKIHKSYSMQKNFSANVAHELRTPLTVLQTKIDVFTLKERSNKEYNEFISTVSSNVERLSNIVYDLLEFTNEENMDITKRVNLKEIIEETIFEFEDLSKEKNIHIKVQCENVSINGNDGFIQQALFNLIENAIKYNNEGGSVEIYLYSKKDDVFIRISDTGMGIPDDMKQSVFEPFFRVDKSRNREIGGSGLGLAIVKNIIERHKGKISIKDNTPKGSIFEIALKKYI